MATGTTGVMNNDREYLFRLQTLIIDGGTEVIRNIFDQRLPGVTLSVFLSKEKTAITTLKRQKTITQAQYDLLYPPGRPPNSANFDITLIICLLRNVRSLGLNQSYQWNVPPQPADLSIEADLCRLKGFRNEVAHISSTKGFQQTSFNAKWTEIEQVLLRLNTTVSSPLVNFNQTIDYYKNIPLDAAMEQRNEIIIQQWRLSERSLETEMLLIKDDVKTLSVDVIDMKQDVSDTMQGVKHIERDVRDTKDGVGNIEQVVIYVRQDIKRLEQNVNETKENVDVIKRQVNVIDMKQDVSVTMQGVQHIERDVRDTKDDVRNIEQVVIYARQDVKRLEQNVNETKEDVHVIKQQVNVIKKDISTIKQGKLSQEEYEEMKSDLQDDLISFYKRQHKSIPLSPLMEEDQPLLKFYEMPDILSVKVTRSRDGDKQEKTPVNTLKDVFYNENKLCSNIYLTADAGYGKTAFSKKLALAWCHAKKTIESEKKHFSKPETEVMHGFSFVFLVLLRDISSECAIDELIWNQVFSQLDRDFSLENLKNILHKEQCLVILDGLDEWSHPLKSCRQGESSIPHQRVRENVAVLTTTRPWKLSVSGLHSSQIDQKLELKGLSDDSSKKLKRSVISYLHRELDESKIDEYETEFNMTVQENHKSDLTGIPLFLMYFLFLWFHRMNVGKSLADLYSSFIELLLSRTEKKKTKTETLQGNIPPCFNNNTLCKQFYTLLTALGKLAFYTLFSETKENTLVFDGCIAEKYLSKDVLTFCLKTGIITQSKVQGASLLQQETKVSFAHKTMQEFLAALYINSATDQKSIQEIMFSKCKCVKDILDMSKILMFIVSISGKLSFSSELMKIINEDEITQQYRRSLDNWCSLPLKDLQDMCISCCKEIPRENEVNLCLQDVFIEKSCQQEEYREHLKGLTTRNKQNIRSVYIDMSHIKDTPYNTGRNVFDYFAISDLENIEKIHYLRTQDKDIDDVILPLLNSSVKSLFLSCFERPSSWSRSLSGKVTSLQKLEAIGIYNFKMSHSELSFLLDFISQKDCLREIVLEVLSCTDHRSSCTGFSLLWRHKPLRKLTLNGLKLSKVIINMASLEYCFLRHLSKEDLVLEFVNCKDNKLNIFRCWDFKSSAAIDEIIRMLQDSRHVREVELWFINLGGRNLTLSPDFVNIKYLDLYRVSMEESAYRELVDSVLKLKQTVTVTIQACTILPRTEIFLFKREPETSQRVRILEKWYDGFKFETIKDGD